MWPWQGEEEVKEENWICCLFSFFSFLFFFFAVLKNLAAFCRKLKQQQPKAHTEQKAAQTVMVGDRQEGAYPVAAAGLYDFSVQTSQPDAL